MATTPAVSSEAFWAFSDSRFNLNTQTGDLTGIPALANSQLGYVTAGPNTTFAPKDVYAFSLRPPAVTSKFYIRLFEAGAQVCITTVADAVIKMEPITSTPDTYWFQPAPLQEFRVVIQTVSGVAANDKICLIQLLSQATISQYFDFNSLNVPAVNISEEQRAALIARGLPLPSMEVAYTSSMNAENSIPNTAMITVRNFHPHLRSPNQNIFCAVMARMQVTVTVSWRGVERATTSLLTNDVSFSPGALAAFPTAGMPTSTDVTLVLCVAAAGSTTSPPFVGWEPVPYSISQISVGGYMIGGAAQAVANTSDVPALIDTLSNSVSREIVALREHIRGDRIRNESMMGLLIKGFKALGVTLLLDEERTRGGTYA